MQRILIIIHDAPYGTEKAYNALRMAMTLQKEYGESVQVRIFLLGDAVFCGLPNQKTPDGYYNIERMLRSVIRRGGEVKSCGTCSEARGIHELPLVEGIQLSNMKEFAAWTVGSDKVLSF
ncbi:MAG TPA: DsrE family protein [Bacteroidales bacterium]|nr:DsrE family protein [Bacteroidales bacterium]HRZ77370.1 DsrE family protein [Bacteroidales bacterium]